MTGLSLGVNEISSCKGEIVVNIFRVVENCERFFYEKKNFPNDYIEWDMVTQDDDGCGFSKNQGFYLFGSHLGEKKGKESLTETSRKCLPAGQKENDLLVFVENCKEIVGSRCRQNEFESKGLGRIIWRRCIMDGER